MTSCTQKMFPDNTLGQTSSSTKNGGIIYPDGSIHYPDGSVRTTDGIVWPVSTAKTSTTKPKSIANDPNVTVVKRGTVPAKTVSSKTTERKIIVKPSKPDEEDVAIADTKSGSSYPDYDNSEASETKKKASTTPSNTSARKDESGRHVRKRGESYFRK